MYKDFSFIIRLLGVRPTVKGIKVILHGRHVVLIFIWHFNVFTMRGIQATVGFVKYNN